MINETDKDIYRTSENFKTNSLSVQKSLHREVLKIKKKNRFTWKIIFQIDLKSLCNRIYCQIFLYWGKNKQSSKENLLLELLLLP